MKKQNYGIILLSNILNLLCWSGLIFGLILGLFTAIGCLNTLFSETSGSTFISGITLGNIQLYSSTGGISVELRALQNMQLISLLVYFVEIPLTAYVIHLLCKVLQPILDNRPFTGTGRLLRKMGWVSLILAAFQNLSDWLLLLVMEHQYHMDEFFLGSVITDVSFHFEPDLTFLVVSIVVFVLSGVFRYGDELQQLSDETV